MAASEGRNARNVSLPLAPYQCLFSELLHPTMQFVRRPPPFDICRPNGESANRQLILVFSPFVGENEFDQKVDAEIADH